MWTTSEKHHAHLINQDCVDVASKLFQAAEDRNDVDYSVIHEVSTKQKLTSCPIEIQADHRSVNQNESKVIPSAGCRCV